MTEYKGIQVLDFKAAVAFATPKATGKPKPKKPAPSGARNDTTIPDPDGQRDHQNLSKIGQSASEEHDQNEAAGASGKPGAPGDRGTDPNDNETADPDNPNGATKEEAEAAGPGNNTTDPLGSGTESDPGVDESDDRILDLPGMEDHSQKAAGTDDVTETRDTLNQLLPSITINARETVVDAIRHLSDAVQQGNFGQWQGAAQSVAHAVAAIGRAQQTTPDGEEADLLGRFAQAANEAGVVLLENNQSPTLPLPVKSFEQLVTEANRPTSANPPAWHGPIYKTLPVIAV